MAQLKVVSCGQSVRRFDAWTGHWKIRTDLTVRDTVIGIVGPLRARTIGVEIERRGADISQVLVVEDRRGVDTVARICNGQLG